MLCPSCGELIKGFTCEECGWNEVNLSVNDMKKKEKDNEES